MMLLGGTARRRGALPQLGVEGDLIKPVSEADYWMLYCG